MTAMDHRMEKARPYLGVINDGAVADRLSQEYGIAVGAEVVRSWRVQLGIPAVKRHNNCLAPDPARAAEHQYWAKLYQQGESVNRIARKLGVAHVVVQVALRSLGVMR